MLNGPAHQQHPERNALVAAALQWSRCEPASWSPPPAVVGPMMRAPVGLQGLVQPWGRWTGGRISSSFPISHCCLGSESLYASLTGQTCCQS